MFQKKKHLNQTADLAHLTVWGGKPETPRVLILAWREQRNAAGTMLGFVDVELPSGMQLYGCKLMVSTNRNLWIALPSSVRRSDAGETVLDEKGRVA